jgi:hypothetical protein
MSIPEPKSHSVDAVYRYSGTGLSTIEIPIVKLMSILGHKLYEHIWEEFGAELSPSDVNQVIAQLHLEERNNDDVLNAVSNEPVRLPSGHAEGIDASPSNMMISSLDHCLMPCVIMRYT